jgi:hypothetical protein
MLRSVGSWKKEGEGLFYSLTLAGGKEVFPHRLSRFELNSQTARDKSP